MAFDPKIAEAQIVLNMIGTTDMPRLAWDALEAGLDGPAIRRLAALDFPTHFQVEEILPRAMEEMQMVKLTPEAAALQLGRMRAREIIRSNDDPLKHVRDFEYMYREADYCRELASVGNLDDEVYVARYCGQSDDEIRAWARKRFEDLARQ